MNRLDYLSKNAKELTIDDTSKIVFISDIHRGDGTYYDALLPNRNIYKSALYYYYKNDFTYIEVGDGDELWKNRNCVHIAVVYEDIFKVLNRFKEENRLYLIYGNHDIIKNKENYYNKQYRAIRRSGINSGNKFLSFIKNINYYEGINFLYKPLEESFLVTHGHQVDIMNNELWMVSRFLVRYVWKFLNGIGGVKDPTSPAINNLKGDKIDNKLRNWSLKNYKMLVCGHTHNSKMPNYLEPPYFNDGCCVLPYAMTAIEIEDGKIKLVKWSVESNELGFLWVRRKIIEGPEKLEKYLLWARDMRNKKGE